MLWSRFIVLFCLRDQRPRIGLSALLAELNEIAFPMPELFALGDGVWSVENVDIRGETPAMAAPLPINGPLRPR